MLKFLATFFIAIGLTKLIIALIAKHKERK